MNSCIMSSFAVRIKPTFHNRIFDKRAHRRLERALFRTGSLDFAERVSEVARILDEDGYLADFARQEDVSLDHRARLRGARRCPEVPSRLFE